MRHMPHGLGTPALLGILLDDALRHGEPALQHNQLQATKAHFHVPGRQGLAVQRVNRAALRQRQPLLLQDVALHDPPRLKRPGVEGVREEDGFVVELAADGREQRHAARRIGVVFFGVLRPPWVLAAAEDATVEATFDYFDRGAMESMRRVGLVFEAHVDLPNSEDEFPYAVAELGGETEEWRESLVSLISTE